MTIGRIATRLSFGTVVAVGVIRIDQHGEVAVSPASRCDDMQRRGYGRRLPVGAFAERRAAASIPTSTQTLSVSTAGVGSSELTVTLNKASLFS
jgi:hypothetical protein